MAREEFFQQKQIPQREPDKTVTLPSGDIICFYELEHIYTVNGLYRICMSDALTGTELKNDISESGINEDYLKECAEFGTRFHKEIEVFIKTGKEPLVKSPSFRFFKENIFPLCEEWHSETMICTEDFVGTCDLWGIAKDGSIIVIDIKTGKVYTDLCEFQETGYGYGLKFSSYIPVSAHINYFTFSAKNSIEECELLPIKEKTSLEMEIFCIAIRNKCKYVAPYEMLNIDPFIPADYPGSKDKFLRNFLIWKQDNSLFENLEKAIKGAIENTDKPSVIFDTPVGFFAYKKSEMTKKVFDQETFKKKCPKMFAKYYVDKTYKTSRFDKKPLSESDLEPYAQHKKSSS